MTSSAPGAVADPESAAALLSPQRRNLIFVAVLLGMLLAAYGLTTREREICLEVISGHSTGAIADRLSISPHTIQDHLKSAFAKVGVRSRGELVATLRPE